MTHFKGSDFVNVVLQNEAVLASGSGEIFCLDALWHNPLRGSGLGPATIATEHSLGDPAQLEVFAHGS